MPWIVSRYWAKTSTRGGWSGARQRLLDELDQRVELRVRRLLRRSEELFRFGAGLHHLGELQEREVATARFLLSLDAAEVLQERVEALGLEALLRVMEMQEDQLMEERAESTDHRSGPGEDLRP